MTQEFLDQPGFCFIDRTYDHCASHGEFVADPKDAIQALRTAKIEFVLMGLYGIQTWLKEPRMTEDFDVLVSVRNVKRAVQAYTAKFPTLTVRDTPVVVRFFDGETAVLDIMKAHHPVFVVALKHTASATCKGLKVNVPTLEMALTLKFFSMTSMGRAQKDKFQDAHDFIGMIEANARVDLVRLQELGELCFDGGGAELVGKVEDVKAGRKLELAERFVSCAQ